VYDVRFAGPVFVRLLGARHPSAVSSLGHAADLLFDNWPRTDGPKYAEARRACLNCDGSDDSLAWTRHAFKEAAREAGILVEDGYFI
jgi:hypothetical protein